MQVKFLASILDLDKVASSHNEVHAFVLSLIIN